MARLWCGLIVVGLALLLSRCALAQGGTEQDMFRKAQLLEGAEQYDQALEQYKAFIAQYPRSKSALEARAAMCGLYLRQQQHDKAVDLWGEMATTATRPRVLWSVIAIDYDLRMKANPNGAKAAFVRVKTGDGFTPTSSDWDRLLWCEYAMRADMPLFIAEGMKVVLQEPDAFLTVRQTILPVMIGQRLYGPLMQAKRFEDAQRIHLRLQDVLALRYNPLNWMGDDDAVYFLALSRYGLEEYANQMLKRAQQLTYMTNTEDCQSEVALICMYYGYALIAGQVETSMKIHAIAQAELKRIGDQNLLMAENQQYQQAFNAISVSALGQQFTKALANHDYTTAKKILTNMKLAAPDHAVTRGAQQQWDAQAPKE